MAYAVCGFALLLCWRRQALLCPVCNGAPSVRRLTTPCGSSPQSPAHARGWAGARWRASCRPPRPAPPPPCACWLWQTWGRPRRTAPWKPARQAVEQRHESPHPCISACMRHLLRCLSTPCGGPRMPTGTCASVPRAPAVQRAGWLASAASRLPGFHVPHVPAEPAVVCRCPFAVPADAGVAGHHRQAGSRGGAWRGAAAGAQWRHLL